MNVTRPTTRHLLALAASVALACALACGGEVESRTTGSSMAASGPAAASDPAPELTVAPRIDSVRLQPERPRPGERLSAQVETSGAQGRELRLEYRWFVDGGETGNTGASFHVEGRGGRDREIEVEVVAVSGATRSDPVRAAVRVGNHPPVLHGLMLEPLGELSAGRDVVASPRASDPDGDELEFEYRWDVNGSTVWTESGVLAASHLERGDSVVVTVVASDGDDTSPPLVSDPIPVVNSVPRITSTPGDFDALGRFVYPVRVEDADGDSAFRYRLAEAPRGMEIDPVDGTVRWSPAESQAGRHPVSIEVRDAHGGTATQSFTLALRFDAAGDPSPPADAR